jgi:predicted ATP-grasp superfamily ATP-dependent carboligase
MPGFVAALRKAIVDEGVDLVIPITDEVILPLLEVRDEIEATCKLALPSAESLSIASDKYQTAELARSLDVPVPRTCLVGTANEARQVGGALGWPVVLKPRFSRRYREGTEIESFGVCYADDPEHLAERMSTFEGRSDVLLQEYYPGAGIGVELLLFEGEPLVAFQHMRLREIPVHGGASAFRVSMPLDHALYQQSVRLLGSLKWTGLAMVEFKVGADGPKLMEINGRVWGSLPLAVHSGVDFPARLADLMVDGPPDSGSEPQTTYANGIRSRNLELDLMWIVNVMLGRKRYPFLTTARRRDAVRAMCDLVNPACRFDILSLRDPLPGVIEISKIISKFRTKVAQPEHAKAT